jgi:hypothetical protein
MPRRTKATQSEPTLNPVEPPVRLLDLIDQYANVVMRGDRDSINETTVRESFLNPILEELGWDPRNRRGVPERDRDVILEDKVHIEGQQKAPDYALVAGGRRRFFVEAKRPSVSIARSTSASYQIRRYCWSAGLPLGVLTNFEEIAVYDCRVMPHIDDTTSENRILYFKFNELPQYWGEFESLFGKGQVLNGSVEKYISDTKAPRQSKPIDDAFLTEIRLWRSALAVDIAGKNPHLDVVDLNEVVQRLIDRLIFLRIAEARGLEPFEGLKEALKAPGEHYERLISIFKRADDRYNSGLFHLSEKKDIPGPPDTLGLEIAVSDAPLARLINQMYYPQPYEFSVMPADILGRIYEQFLGERIEFDSKRKVVVQLKPDLRKSGGVYYTPQPVVNFIVDNTIGPLLKGKTPADVEKLRIVDPACGSGSFLIAAYQYIMDWHRDYYADKVRLAKANLQMGTDGVLRLKTPIRRRILLNNIYGVDIDPQAVEVTKLSLLLKVIEGQDQMELAVGRVLPDLAANIACGNSLIECDFEMPGDLTREEKLIYNPFEWKAKWPEILSAGGFDAVIGNPPYLNIDKVWGRRDPRLGYIKQRYSEVYSDKTDILFYFLRRSADICKGEMSFIVSRSFLEADKARDLRKWLGGNLRFREILDFRHALVFPKVSINTAIVRFTKSRSVKETLFRRWVDRNLPLGYDEHTLADRAFTSQVSIPYSDLGSNPWNFGTPRERELVDRMDKVGHRLGDVLHIGQGMQTAANKVFELDVAAATYNELHKVLITSFIKLDSLTSALVIAISTSTGSSVILRLLLFPIDRHRSMAYLL